MIALSDNPSIPHSGADDYCPENMSKKLLRSLYIKIKGSLTLLHTKACAKIAQAF